MSPRYKQASSLRASNSYCDHVGGFPVIVRALRVNVIADSGQQYGGHAFNDGSS
jgi:hypothetical protein